MERVAYCYFVCGHIRVQPPQQEGCEAEPQPYTAPFDTVVRLRNPVTSDQLLEVLGEKLKDQIRAELKALTGDHKLLDKPLIRQVSLLHTIIVDDEDFEGVPARVLS